MRPEPEPCANIRARPPPSALPGRPDSPWPSSSWSRTRAAAGRVLPLPRSRSPAAPSYHRGAWSSVHPYPALDPGERGSPGLQLRETATPSVACSRAWGSKPQRPMHAALALAEHLDRPQGAGGAAATPWFSVRTRSRRSSASSIAGEGRVTLARAARRLGRAPGCRSSAPSTPGRTAGGVLEGSLEAAVRAAGADPQAHACGCPTSLQWDLDFNRDLRLGDRVRGAVRGGLPRRPASMLPGNVLAMTYENGGRRLEAYRFDGGYYDSEGQPMQARCSCARRSPTRGSPRASVT